VIFRGRVIQNDYRKLGPFAAGLLTHENMYTLGTEARAVMLTRTQLGRDEDDNAFVPYSTKRYYAPIARRPLGYPKPAGGRTHGIGKRAKKRLKTMAFDGGYRHYKVGGGWGATPQLSVSNRMQNDLVVTTPNERTAVLSFVSERSDTIAEAHDKGIGVPRRKWFGVGSSVSREQIERKYIELMESLKRRVGI